MRVAALAAFAAVANACAPPSATPRVRWLGTWAAAQQRVEPRNMPPAPGLAGGTVRQVIHTSIGGQTLRVRFSNTFGDGPLAITAALLLYRRLSARERRPEQAAAVGDIATLEV